MRNNKFLIFFVTIILLIITIIIALISGDIKASFLEIIQGMFNSNYENVNIIKEIRLPRIIITLLAGSALAVSGLLLQTSLKNPLLDPSIMGVSSGANLFLYIGLMIAPNLIIYKSLFSILGGIISFLLIYMLTKNKKSNVTIILVGIAISSFFTGILKAFSFFGGSTNTMSINLTLGLKSWEDVYLLLIWIPLLIVLSLILANLCNIFFLDDNIINSLGVNLSLIRLSISLIAVILASIASSVVGNILFLALLIPHIAKLVVGKNHKYSIPFSVLLGSLIFLIFDTFGRTVFSPIEIPADIIMLILGAPFFLLLINRGSKYD